MDEGSIPDEEREMKQRPSNMITNPNHKSKSVIEQITKNL